jgi:m7GpppX diphosphatase
MNALTSVLIAPACEAQTLSVSDQHATVLVKNDEQTEQSLVKLTVIPFHREVFQASESNKILSFLNDYDFSLTSESGAEYSYHDALPKKPLFLSRFLRGHALPANMGAFKVELISPASDRQIQRAMPKPGMVLIEETPEMYATVAKPYIQSIIEGGSLSWIENVVSGKKERERLLLDQEDFILNVDTKWRSHPDANAVPRSEWYGHESVVDLYCLAIVKDGGIASLRDLNSKHIPVLQSIVKDGSESIEKIYGVQRNQLRIFVHYHPQFYRFHVHFTRLWNEVGCQVERGHLVSDIIQNLQMDGEFYSKRTITYKLPINDKLYMGLKEGQND